VYRSRDQDRSYHSDAFLPTRVVSVGRCGRPLNGCAPIAENQLTLNPVTVCRAFATAYGRSLMTPAHTLRLVGATAFFSLSLMAVPAFADNCGNDKSVGNAEGCATNSDTPAVSATPELGSLVLFGTGLAGAGGYALTRFRARRRRDEHVESNAT
jgi:hypothetical protein